ncbi:hypothetical protein M9458_039235, partial [Cirrhinus mrigala]
GDECVLMTVITGDALSLLRDLQDSQVVDLCMGVLRELFQEQVTSFAQFVICPCVDRVCCRLGSSGLCGSDVALQDVPDPVRFFVTRWSRDPWSRMSYSFVKTGGSGEAYDIIAEDVQGKLFFAGE